MIGEPTIKNGESGVEKIKTPEQQEKERIELLKLIKEKNSQLLGKGLSKYFN